jgi:hypothetical protein
VTAAGECTDELLRPFLDAIDADPSDPNPVAILRDRLHELGDPRAAGMDWLIEHSKRPERFNGDYKVWAWWASREQINTPHHLPMAAWRLVRGSSLSLCVSDAYLNAAAAVSTWLTGER